MEQILPEAVLRRMEDREVIADSKHGFTKGKSFYGGVTTAVAKGRAVGTIPLHSCKALDMVPHKILLFILETHGFDGCLMDMELVG